MNAEMCCSVKIFSHLWVRHTRAGDVIIPSSSVSPSSESDISEVGQSLSDGLDPTLDGDAGRKPNGGLGGM